MSPREWGGQVVVGVGGDDNILLETGWRVEGREVWDEEQLEHGLDKDWTVKKDQRIVLFLITKSMATFDIMSKDKGKFIASSNIEVRNAFKKTKQNRYPLYELFYI
jgi:predicted type IV restriction endonuclease